MTDDSTRPDAPLDKKGIEYLGKVMETLRNEVEEKNHIFVGQGAERRFGISKTNLSIVVSWLKEDGYVVHLVKMERPDSEDSELFVVKVLSARGVTYQDVWRNRGRILKQWLDSQSSEKN